MIKSVPSLDSALWWRCAVLGALALSGAASAQAPDTLHLADLRAAAARQDARAVQPTLMARASALRLESLRAGRLPRLAVMGQATLQNEVPSIPISLPDQTLPEPPLAQARVQAEADWLVSDGGRRAGQADIERARLAESVAGVEVTLYALREATTEAFFGALLMQARAHTLALAADDLHARLAFVRARVADGAALAADAAALEADGIRLRQHLDEAESGWRAALAVLADLTGRAIATDAVLALPDLGATTTSSTEPSERPERVRFERVAERLAAEARAADAATRPQVSVFGQAGVGRPSPFDLFSDSTKPFALAGVRLRWAPLDWGQSRRTAEALRIQARITETEAAAFEAGIARAALEDLATIDRLDAVRSQDDRVVALREEVLRVARHQLDEGVLLPPDYADRVTDLAVARLVRDRHRIERAHAQARVLSTVGRFPEPRSSRALDR